MKYLIKTFTSPMKLIKLLENIIRSFFIISTLIYIIEPFNIIPNFFIGFIGIS
jgi:uncharacterized membrane protein YkvA (DUF1232 family)